MFFRKFGIPIFLIVLFLFFEILPARAQVVLNPKYYKFGEVQSGKTYHLKVKIANTTKQTISLWNLRADCDCTTAHIVQAVLKPKTSTNMNIEYHPQEGDNGFKTFTINFQVYSQDKNKAMRKTMEKFMFSAELHSPYLLDPAALDGGYGMVGRPLEAKGVLKLDNKKFPGWEPVKAQVSIEGIQAEVKPSATPGVFSVRVSVPATFLHAGNYNGAVTITGQEGKKTKEFLYPFRFIVGSLWSVTPNPLELGELNPSRMKNSKWSTQVREIYGKPFKIVKVVGLPDWLNDHIGKSPAGDTLIQWEIDKGKLERAKDGPLNPEVTIQTDLKDEPTFKISVNAVKASREKKPSSQPKVAPTSTVTNPTPSGGSKKTQ